MTSKVALVTRSDPCLFAAFALLNACGYNSENGWQFTEVRKVVRLRLASRAASWKSALKNAGLLEATLRTGGAMLMDIVPLLSGPPDFVFQTEDVPHAASWQRESKLSLAGIEQWLKRFYKEEALDLLWSEHFLTYEQAEGKLQRSSSLLEKISSYFEEPSLDIVLVPNLLDARGRGYSVSTPRSTWLFFGPLEDESQVESLAVHELLHRWVDVAAEIAVSNGGGADPMPRARAQFRIVAESYPDFAIWISETVVRAATTWLMRNRPDPMSQSVDDAIAYSERIGFIGIQEAYQLFSSGPKGSLGDAIREAVDVVYNRILRVCGTSS